MKTPKKILRSPEILMKIIDEETVLYDTRQEMAHFLNETASLIWNLCDGTRQECEIVAEIAGRFDVPKEVVERDVRNTLGNLSQQKLIL